MSEILNFENGGQIHSTAWVMDPVRGLRPFQLFLSPEALADIREWGRQADKRDAQKTKDREEEAKGAFLGRR